MEPSGRNHNNGKKDVKEVLAHSELLYRSLFESMNEGFCLHEIVTDNSGIPCNYFILDANPAFEKIIGIKVEDVIGRYATEVYNVSSAPYLELYSKVALSGEPARFETDYTPMQKTFSITVFSPSRGTFATIFEDISVRKQAELTILQNEARLRSLIDIFSMSSTIFMNYWNFHLMRH